MNFLTEMWTVIAGAVMSWFSSLDNAVLDKVVSLSTLLVIFIGLTDWCIRRHKQRRTSKNEKRRRLLDLLEGMHKPFKAVNMLDSPTETGEKIGEMIEYLSHEIGGNSKMKKFFKWVWYNKEQLLSIAFNVFALALANIAMFTGWLDGLFVAQDPTTTLVVKIAAAVLGGAFTALSVRNTCVKYGLSSLATIDSVLAEKAQATANKLTPEQKKTLKTSIHTIKAKIEVEKAALATAEAALVELNALYSADPSLAQNYNKDKPELEKTIAQSKKVIDNATTKLTEYKAQLAGKTPVEK